MEFKIDTKEKFFIIQPDLKEITAIMAEELVQRLQLLSENEPFNIILNLKEAVSIEDKAAAVLAAFRNDIYHNDHSFVVCALQQAVSERIESLGLEDAINITPTESEAWDIVQMDEMEREFLNGDDATA
jgi:anti-anti-sigma factor